MPERIKLPTVTGFTVSGFEPIYSADVELKMSNGPYVILGGNGLGKTTLMQAIIYALAGGLDEKLEDNKALRWSSSYFRGRLSPSQIATAQVEVEFKLGRHTIAVRRGFKGAQVIAVKDGKKAWVEENAPEVFKSLIREYGGYLDEGDFSFAVHRLLYLTESRRLIAWDTDAQIRLLMLLNQDIAVERDFREARAELKLLDSKKRHIRVALNKTLESLLEFDSEGETETPEEDVPVSVEQKADEETLPQVASALHEVTERRITSEVRTRKALSDLSIVSAELQKLRERIDNAEAGLVANFLATTEREQNLALAKLVQSDICPACGQRHVGLADIARKHLRDHRCALCGSEESHVLNPELASLREALEERMRTQQAFEEVVRIARVETEGFRNQEFDLQSRVNKIRFRSSVVGMVQPQLSTDALADLEQRKAKLEHEEADAELQIRSIQDRLTAEYESFRQKMDSRMQSLHRTYSEFATAFLGLPCELVEINQSGLLDLKLFVPRFSDVDRPSPESCSEAQRFFLDIAFRMSLIDAAGGDQGTATFFCETPETALDVSYIDNVVSMFMSFAQRQHNILLTANVQSSGIAEKLLSRVPTQERAGRMVNLLTLGRLSQVQIDAKVTFDRILRRMLTAKLVSG